MRVMIRILLFSLVVALAACSFFNTDFEHKWKKFKTTFEKSYQNPKEEFRRRQIWEKNVVKSVRHNRMADMGFYSFQQSINEYSDMSAKELKRVLNGYKMKPLSHSSWKPLTQKLPQTVDWRDTGYVTPIKNQFACGSCWAFSAVGSLEGQHKKKMGQLVSLSEQNLVDCSDKEGNKGCNGGLMDQAFEYVKRNPGIDTEKFYPYLGWQQMSCYFDPMYVGANCSGYVDLPSGDEEALKQAVATIGPVSVAIDAGLDSFHLYADGIYDDPNCTDYALDHGILVIGYGTENGSDYWLIKNSWGTSWGMKGFGKMVRNKNNQCGIATQASYPLM